MQMLRHWKGYNTVGCCYFHLLGADINIWSSPDPKQRLEDQIKTIRLNFTLQHSLYHLKSIINGVKLMICFTVFKLFCIINLLVLNRAVCLFVSLDAFDRWMWACLIYHSYTVWMWNLQKSKTYRFSLTAAVHSGLLYIARREICFTLLMFSFFRCKMIRSKKLLFDYQERHKDSLFWSQRKR